MINYGFIGAGNMAKAMIQGLLKSGVPSSQIIACSPHATSDSELQTWQIHTSTDNTLACQQPIVILAVKPQKMKAVCELLAASLAQTNPLLISVAAGIQTQQITRWLGYTPKLIRMMPNTPALCGRGTTGLFAPPTTSAYDKTLSEKIAQSFGIGTWLEEESMMDLLTAVAGSGPAYFLYMVEAITEGAIRLGMKPELAQLLTHHTLAGSAQLLLSTQKESAILRQEITSPHGVTEQAIKILDKHNLKNTLLSALEVATQRSIDLSTQWDT